MGQLIFIYNIGSSLRENATGALKKALGGSSSCALCNITYGPIKEKKEWKEFTATLDVEPVYYHVDEIPPDIGTYMGKNSIGLPVVLRQDVDGYEVLASDVEMLNCVSSPACLIDIISSRL